MSYRNRNTSRRGVLLLVILGLLAMFGLVAIALVVIAGNAKDTAEIHQRLEQYSNRPEDNLGQGLLQVVRGSVNPESVIGPHSLLEDIYGEDTYVGQIDLPPTAPPKPVARTYVDPTATPPVVVEGQLIEFPYSLFGTVDEARQRVGCVITITSGPAAGASAHIVGVNPSNGNPQFLAGTIRLLGADGKPGVAGVDDDNNLTVDDLSEIGWYEDLNRNGEPDFPGEDLNGNGDLDLSDDELRFADTFIVNGVPFSGTGFGYDTVAGDLGETIGGRPIGLVPNPTFANYQTWLNGSDPVMANEDYDAPDYQNMLLAMIMPDGTVIPSLHRPSLVNYWNTTDPALNPNRYTLRPSTLTGTFDPVAGPWDVDNDGDGIPDSIWVDLGLPVRSASDGRLYKPLFAVLCLDLDGRLDLNAHGCLAQTVDTDSDFIPDILFDTDSDGIPDRLNDVAATLTYADGSTSARLPRGQGNDPPEINLTPVLVGHPVLAGTQYDNLLTGTTAWQGRYGAANPGVSGRNDYLDFNKHFMFRTPFNYPNTLVPTLSTDLYTYGTPPDRKGTLAVGIDLRGQPVYKLMGSWANAAVDDPYELDLSRDGPKGVHGGSPVDNAFSLGELERVLRPYDVDSGTLPSRLSDLAPSLIPSASLPGGRRLEVTTASSHVPCPSLGAITALSGVQVSHLYEWMTSGTIPLAEINDAFGSELASGLRMDINRPFGDGWDNDGNFVVDDPRERMVLAAAGMIEQLWQKDGTGSNVLMGYNDANGDPVFIPFDHDNDGVEPIVSGGAITAVPEHDDTGPPYDPRFDHYGKYRQRFARNLYVLLHVLVYDEWYPPGIADPGPLSSERAEALAQWAINVVDFRDRDSIMTPFEYDPNPRNGWDVDDDISTDEDGDSDPTTRLNVVWGCERPELLISETLGTYDTRMEDRDDDNGVGDKMAPTGTDPDPDQRFRPEESLFVELFNPWTGDEAPPAEFYYKYNAYDEDDDGTISPTGDWPAVPSGEGVGWGTGATGVKLNQTTPTAEKDPVWRLAIVERDEADAESDPDERDIERSIYFVDPGAGITDHGTAYYPGVDVPAPAPVLPNRYVVIGSGDPGSGAAATTFMGFRNGQANPNGDTRRIILTPNSNESTTGQVAVYTDGTTDSLSALSIRNPTAVVVNAPKRLTLLTDPADYAAATLDPTDPTGTVYKFSATLDRPPDMDNPYWSDFLDVYTTEPRVRIIQLQRLADPLEAWHEITNPYITIDIAQIDLTVFNGVTNDLDPTPAPTYNFFTRERGETTGSNNLWKAELPGAAQPTDSSAAVSPAELHWFNDDLQNTLGYLNAPFGNPRTTPAAYAGDPQDAFPWLTWNNRPFISQMELMMVPRTPASMLLSEFDISGGNPYTSPTAPFPHLLNFFESDATTSPPAGNFYRLLEFVRVPSRFTGTELQGDPQIFEGTAGGDHQFHPPFNLISRYWEPGRMNINTVASPDVWEGFMNYFPGFSGASFFENSLVASRRGYNYTDGSTGPPVVPDVLLVPGTDPVAEMMHMNPRYPTRFANAFRSFAGNELVPPVPDPDPEGSDPADDLLGNTIGEPVNATVLRHDPSTATLPLFAMDDTRSAEFNDGSRNPYFYQQGIQRLGNLVTTRSNVYAIWITVGYFEVDNGDPTSELGTDSGEISRHRAFYVFDRSIPVGFRRGEDLNVEKGILLRRMIE